MTWRLASLLGRHGGDYGTKDIQVLHYVIWSWRRILNGAGTSISNLPEIIAWQTHKDDRRPEARGPLKSGAWGGRPTCHPQTPPLTAIILPRDRTDQIVKDNGQFGNFTFLFNVVGFRITWHKVPSSQPMLYNTLSVSLLMYVSICWRDI